MKRYILFPVFCIVTALLFPGCDEEKDQGFLKLLPLVSMMNTNRVSFDSDNENNFNVDPVQYADQSSMTSADGFILVGDEYSALFTDGIEDFEVTIPATVTGSSTYTEVSGHFMITYTQNIEGFPTPLTLTDEEDFTFQVTSLSNGRIEATFSGVLFTGAYETIYAISALSNGTLSASIGE